MLKLKKKKQVLKFVTFFFTFYLCIYVYTCVNIYHMYVGTCTQKWAFDPLKLELYMVLNSLMWGLGGEPSSFGRTSKALLPGVCLFVSAICNIINSQKILHSGIGKQGPTDYIKSFKTVSVNARV